MINYCITDLSMPPTGQLMPFNADVALSQSHGRDRHQIPMSVYSPIIQVNTYTWKMNGSMDLTTAQESNGRPSLMDLCSNILAIEYRESYYKISHSMIVRWRLKTPPKHMLRLTTEVSIGVRKPRHRGLPKNSDAFPVAVTLLDKVTC